MAFAIVAGTMARCLPLLLCIAGALAGCIGDEALDSGSAAIPAQQRDPELRKEESASAGATRPAAHATPGAFTDLGREAEKEEEELLQRQKLPAPQQ